MSLNDLGPFDIVMSDPPWQYEHMECGNLRAVEEVYDTLTLDDIKAMVPPAKKDSVLFLWATAPKLQESLDVLNAWGFTYRTHAIWDKVARHGMGHWFLGQHELLLVGRRGKFPSTPPTRIPLSIFREKKRQHSRKPEIVYRFIEQAWPDALKMSMFARESRAGWLCWGNELPGGYVDRTSERSVIDLAELARRDT